MHCAVHCLITTVVLCTGTVMFPARDHSVNCSNQSVPALSEPGEDIAGAATRWSGQPELHQHPVVTSHRGMYIFTWTSTGAKTTSNPTDIIIYFLFQPNRIVFMRIEYQFILSSRLGQSLTSLSKRSHKLDIKMISSSHIAGRDAKFRRDVFLYFKFIRMLQNLEKIKEFYIFWLFHCKMYIVSSSLELETNHHQNW